MYCPDGSKCKRREDLESDDLGIHTRLCNLSTPELQLPVHGLLLQLVIECQHRMYRDVSHGRYEYQPTV